MANQWLRLWHDMPTDPKWRTISRVSGQPIATVQAVYLHLLVDASRNVTRGVTNVTIEDLASALDVTDEAINSVINAMQGRVLDGNELSGWNSRQPKKEDAGNPETGAKSSADRKRDQRERDKIKSFLLKKEGLVDECHSPSQNVTTDKIREDKEKSKDTTVLLREDGEDSETLQKNQDSSMRWVEFFVNKKSFQIHEAQTAKTIPMFLTWVSMGVTVADVELAMVAANNVLNGSKPSNPVYYRNFVEQVMQEKIKIRGNQSNNSGAINDTNNQNFKTSANSGRKLSIVENAAASTARVEARERWEQQQRESVVN